MCAAQNDPRGIPSVSVDEAARLQADGQSAILVDVRELDEFVQLRAERSVLIPLSEFEARYAELPRDRHLLMLCRSGMRSGRATAFLLHEGYGDVSNVTGGMIAWKQADLPTRNGPLDAGEGEL